MSERCRYCGEPRLDLSSLGDAKAKPWECWSCEKDGFAPPASPADERCEAYPGQVAYIKAAVAASCPSCHGFTRDHRETHPICKDDWHNRTPASTAGREGPVAWACVGGSGRVYGQNCAATMDGAEQIAAERKVPMRVVPLYTRAAPAHAGTARAEALEEAAKVCETVPVHYDRGPEKVDKSAARMRRECVEAILALAAAPRTGASEKEGT